MPTDPARQGLMPTDPVRQGLLPSDPARQGLLPTDQARQTLLPTDPARQTLLPSDPVRQGDEAWRVRVNARAVVADVEEGGALVRLLRLYLYPLYAIVQLGAVLTYLALHPRSQCLYPLKLWLVAQGAVTCATAYHQRRGAEGRLHSTRTMGRVLWMLGLWYLMGLLSDERAQCDSGDHPPLDTKPPVSGLLLFTLVVWGMESVGLVLPLVLLLLMCACLPCLLLLAHRLNRPTHVALDPAILQALPRTRYESLGPAPADTSCSVCLADYLAQDVVLTLPCGHRFHSACAESWLKVSKNCPICRGEVGLEV
jgi:hypothetical protein